MTWRRNPLRMPPRPQLSLPTPGSRRAVVVGAGSFGTAMAVLLARGGLRTTLHTRTTEQALRLAADRENKVCLPEVELRIAGAERGGRGGRAHLQRGLALRRCRARGRSR
jgi:threonine dehydrogenase-like Zn-dependent dehydrogenase